MAKTPEGKVKDAVKAAIGEYSNAMYFMPVSGGFGFHGVHDFIVCVAGRFLSIECKADGGRITELQSQFTLKVHGAGGLALYIVGMKDVDLVRTYLDMMGGIRK